VVEKIINLNGVSTLRISRKPCIREVIEKLGAWLGLELLPKSPNAPNCMVFWCAQIIRDHRLNIRDADSRGGKRRHDVGAQCLSAGGDGFAGKVVKELAPSPRRIIRTIQPRVRRPPTLRLRAHRVESEGP
jgi:hypothetical protein